MRIEIYEDRELTETIEMETIKDKITVHTENKEVLKIVNKLNKEKVIPYFYPETDEYGNNVYCVNYIKFDDENFPPAFSKYLDKDQIWEAIVEYWKE